MPTVEIMQRQDGHWQYRRIDQVNWIGPFISKGAAELHARTGQEVFLD